jgi:hypothetical protein
MASGIVRKAMVYLGLTDDEYEDYDVYDDGGSGPRRYAEPVESTAGSVSAVRPVRGDAGDPSEHGQGCRPGIPAHADQRGGLGRGEAAAARTRTVPVISADSC